MTRAASYHYCRRSKIVTCGVIFEVGTAARVATTCDPSDLRGAFHLGNTSGAASFEAFPEITGGDGQEKTLACCRRPHSAIHPNDLQEIVLLESYNT